MSWIKKIVKGIREEINEEIRSKVESRKVYRTEKRKQRVELAKVKAKRDVEESIGLKKRTLPKVGMSWSPSSQAKKRLKIAGSSFENRMRKRFE